MKDGFVRVGCVNPFIRIADIAHNSTALIDEIQNAIQGGAKVVLSPELSLTGASCADLFFQDVIASTAEKAVVRIAKTFADTDALIVVGAPVKVGAYLYDCAVAISAGQVLGLVPRRALNGASFNLSPYFSAGPDTVEPVDFAGSVDIPLGRRQVFACDSVPDLVVGIEVGCDAYPLQSCAAELAQAQATLILNPCATPELVGRQESRRELVSFKSRNLTLAYMLCEAGQGESSTDFAFGGHSLIAEQGSILTEDLPFEGRGCATEIDVSSLVSYRHRNALFTTENGTAKPDIFTSYFDLTPVDTPLTRPIAPLPFVPEDTQMRSERCEHILNIQAQGLARRMAHIKTQRAILGVSGGLDSTLAMLVCQRAFDLLGVSCDGILAITMPGFGTTSRTKTNAERLSNALGATLLEIDITASVLQHFGDIGHDEEEHDATYENAQARERTQILMDIANTENGIVVGTGDLSELALGWATYNGDHMSMYGVNAGVPKTLIRHLVRHVAQTCENEELTAVLTDILDTPVSPELLPADKEGEISQKTEDIVGPYELHDFFLYNLVYQGFTPSKVYRLAQLAFDGEHGANPYDEQTILKWLKTFCSRFITQQFKRSCLPDGPAVGSVSLSPRAGIKLPSDATSALWEYELSKLEKS